VVHHDCGTVVNPTIVEGQIRGGVAQGIGGAFYERIVYDASGQPLTTTLMDFLLPTAMEVPAVEIGHTETPSPLNPLGTKGVGEGGAIPGPAVIAEAIDDALAPLGVRVREMPLDPARLRMLIEAARPLRESTTS
jgi:CO/xanthine dehydrogenase Mo-binding subunit